MNVYIQHQKKEFVIIILIVITKVILEYQKLFLEKVEFME